MSFARRGSAYPQPNEVSAAIAEAGLEAERLSARVRLGVIVALGVLLVVLGAISNRIDAFLVVVYALNLALSVLSLRLVSSRWFGPSMPWLLTTLDAALLFQVLVLGPVGRALPGAYTTAISVSWAAFLLLALAALRAEGPGLVLYATGLLAGGLTFTMVFDPVVAGAGETILGAFGPQIAAAFGGAPNAFRVASLVLTGIVLAIGVLRSQRTLRRAVALARERRNLARHFSAPLADVIAQEDHSDLRRGREQPIGVLFADLRGFTALSENLPPAEVVNLLNGFRSLARAEIEGHGGIVDKFIGDAVLGVFGVPFADGFEASKTLAASLSLSREIQVWSGKRERAGLSPVSLGIGAHYGKAFVGAVGDEERVEFTVIGDAVNVAQRIERATKTEQVAVLVSHDLLVGAAVTIDGLTWLELPPSPVHGRSGLVRICRQIP